MKNNFPKNKEVFWCSHPEWTIKTIHRCWFKRIFETKSENCELRISVSADNRYILYLDGKLLGRGPCRSDLHHWNYENYNVSLKPGKHVLCAKVAQLRDKTQIIEGKEIALAESGVGMAFLCVGAVYSKGKEVLRVDTCEEWLCKEDLSTKNRPHNSEHSLNTFLVSPPEEEIDFNLVDLNVHSTNIDSWLPVSRISPALQRDCPGNTISRWWLSERQIPMMEEEEKKFAEVIKTENIDLSSANNWLYSAVPIEIKGEAKIVLDAGRLYTAFPKLKFSGKKGTELIIRYSEALFVNGQKLRRDDPRGEVFGYSDRLILSGNEDFFEPFWFRTFRFIEIQIKSAPSAITRISSPAFKTYMYPFKLKADFDAENDCKIRKIWDIGWHTARLCANEHYFDCPYYEQLQYVGDTRIQALISYALTGDGRLGRQAIRHFDWSRLPEGITQSRYPSTWTQIIPGFSLYWVMMIKDYYDYFGDKEFLAEIFPGICSVLDWFERRRTQNGLLSPLPYWNFTDWLHEWPMGDPSRGKSIPLTINSLQYAYACDIAAYIANEIGRNSTNFRKICKETLSAVNKYCRRKDNVYLDMPGEEFTSQHVNACAIIYGAVKGKEAQKLARRLYSDPEMSKATLYFSFYLFRAWEKTGCYEFFWKQLELWKKQLELGLSTFPETPDNSRSDCHAWSSSPLYEFITVCLGVKPASPGFKKILIAPQPSPFKEICGKVPTPFGIINVKIVNEAEKLTIRISCPKNAQIVVKDKNVKVYYS